jgi:acetyl-CoA synthetase (ADP-forming)
MTTKTIFNKAKKEDRKILTIDESFEVLKEYRIPVADYVVVKSKSDAVEAAKQLGYPVVLKAISKKVSHKTDVGAIFLSLYSEKAVQDAFDEISKNVKKAKAELDSVLVQKMIVGGQEIMIGGKKDPQFGQTIAFGLGGIFVEVLEDVAFRVVPIKKEDAEKMMKEIKGYKILSGFRGKKYDTGAIVDALMKISKMLDENQNIVELDLNPIIALPKGTIAVDARIILE